MDIKELRAKSTQELERLIADMRKDLTRGSFQKATGQMNKLKEMRQARKTLARAQTILAEKTNA